MLDEKFSTKSSFEWARVFRENEVVFSLVNELANEQLSSFDHPVWGRTAMAGFPFALSKTPCSVGRGSPELGQRTEEVLMEMLNYTWDDIRQLKEEEVI